MTMYLALPIYVLFTILMQTVTGAQFLIIIFSHCLSLLLLQCLGLLGLQL